jgi:histidinol dehydrogenase
VVEEAMAALPDHWAKMTAQRIEFSKIVLTGPYGGILLTSSVEESYQFINDYAPEHLELLSTEPFTHLGHITEAAEILMGPHTPVCIGNFSLGPNAVLPTSQGAQTYGPLSVHDFMKRSSVGYVTPPAYPELAKRARVLARYEGFSSHENAVSPIRERYL